MAEKLLSLDEIKVAYPPREQNLINPSGKVYARGLVSRDEKGVIRYVEPGSVNAIEAGEKNG